jgi:hypothetical protein
MYSALLKHQLVNDSPQQQQQQQHDDDEPWPPITLDDGQFWVPRNASLGLGRFANEVWIGSHPDVTPCDVSPATSFAVYKNANAVVVVVPEPQFGMLPKRTFQDIVDCVDIGSFERKQRVVQNETLRKRDLFLLPGLLFKWAFHYQSLPLNSSWVFDQYPDGPFWREAVEQHRLA